MTTRRQTRAGPTAIQYEDLQPTSEWTEQPAANLLNIHLPGFVKEQLRITYAHSSRKVTVTGERQVTGNKWSRFSLGFPVPRNCEVNKIQGKFQNGDLIITMPKLDIRQPATREEPKVVKEASVPPKIASTSTGKEGNEKIVTTPKTPEKPTTELKASKSLEDTALFSFSSKKRVEEKKGGDFSPQKDQDEAPQKTISTADTMKQKDEKNVTNEKLTTEAVKEKMMLEQRESCKKRKESMVTESEDISKKKKEPMVTGESLETRKEKSDDDYAAAGAEKGKQDFKNISEKVKEIGDVAAATAKKTMKGAMEMSGERQAIMNMGVAVLVIVAVGAHIAYSYRSSGNVQG